jgi:hypothetical protein
MIDFKQRFINLVRYDYLEVFLLPVPGIPLFSPHLLHGL